jgi:hypothetical protein
MKIICAFTDTAASAFVLDVLPAAHGEGRPLVSTLLQLLRQQLHRQVSGHDIGNVPNTTQEC